MPVGLAIRARELGVDILTGRKVIGLTQHRMQERESKKRHWCLATMTTTGSEMCSSGRSQPGSLIVTHNNTHCDNECGEISTGDSDSDAVMTVSADVVINCAGEEKENIRKLTCIYIIT